MLINNLLSSLRHPPSILTLLKACRTIRSLEQVHTKIILTGCEQDHKLITEFITVSTSLSCHPSYTTSIFERVKQPNIYIWNTVIKFYSEKSTLVHSILIFNQLQKSILPDKYTFPLLIRSCASCLALREGRIFHALTVRYGTDSDVFVSTSLVDLYGKCNEIKCARKVFDEMPLRSVVSWTALVVGYINIGDLTEAKNLFDVMPIRSMVSWNAMISGFVRFGDLVSARKLFDEMPKKNAISYTTMIDCYAKSGDMASAKILFDKLLEKDIVSWSALISGYVQNGNPTEAVEVFHEMKSRNVKPDEFVMVSLMSACAQLGCLEMAKWIDSYLSKSSFDHCRKHLAAALLDMNTKCGNMDRANFLFESMPNRDLISYCSMIQGLSIHGYGRQAVALFDRMLNEGLVPDDAAFTVILTACSRSGLVEEGLHYFGSLTSEYSLIPSADQYACIADLLGRSGKLEAAYNLVKSLPIEPHAGAWGSLMGACKLHGELELGEKIAHVLFELEPLNGGNYVMLSNIYAEADRWSDVSNLRNKMNEKGIKKIPGYTRLRSPFAEFGGGPFRKPALKFFDVGCCQWLGMVNVLQSSLATDRVL